MPREPIGGDDDQEEDSNPEEDARSSGVDESAEVEALLDQLAAEQDVWEWIETIQHKYKVSSKNRQQYYDQFIALVCQRPAAERDALVAAGHHVFRYRNETARKDIERMRQAGGDETKIAPSVIADDFIAEIVHVPGQNPSIQFMVYRVDGTSELADRVQLGTTVYMPPQTRLVDTRTLRLPTGIEEYGETADLVRDLRNFIARYVHFGAAPFRSLAAYYVLLTWIYDKFDVVPYLRLIGEWGSGKSRGLQVIGSISFRSIFAGGATTPSPIFRIVERFKGTLLIDEADFSESDMWAEMVKILLCGYQNEFPVLRSEKGGKGGDHWDPESFNVYGPKLLSTRKRFTDQALESRCLTHSMPVSGIPPSIPLFLGSEFKEEAKVLQNKLLLWRFRNYRAATADPRQRFEGLDARLNQILLPLLAVNTSETIRKSILGHALDYQNRLHADRRDSWEGKIAYCLLKRWARAQGKTSGRVLMKEVNEEIDREFADASKKPDPRAVGRTIRDTFDVSTEHRGGMVWVLMTPEKAIHLCARYALARDQFGLGSANGGPEA